MEKILLHGAKQLGLEVNPEPFLLYLDLLHKWNNAYNLTAIRSPLEMVSKHILDSLAIVQYIRSLLIADVGSGAGLPGIPLALYFPQKKIVLFESIGKKARFLDMVVRVLKLNNVVVINQRVEDYKGAADFDTVVFRAVGSIMQIIKWTKPLIAPHGCWLAMKGNAAIDECAKLNNKYTCYNYKVPEVDGEKHLIIVENTGKY